MQLLGIDIGSSSVKAGILRATRVVGKLIRESFPTHYDGIRAEVDANDVLRAVGSAIRKLGGAARRVDAIALSGMAPSWVAIDHDGRAITPIVTHQDRRSVEVARELERRVGKARHLRLSGNRPFPGGISSTTWAWFARHEPRLMKKADLCGHVTTLLHRELTHARITDPSNASFMGLYALDQSGWSDELIAAAGVSRHCLPQVVSADAVEGMVTRGAGRRYGLTHGTPVLAGMIDTGSAMLLAGARAGQLLNTCGSTDALALCVDKPRPRERLLTRALGVEKKWLSVSTIAATGSALSWMNRQFFADLSREKFGALVRKLAKKPLESTVQFDPHLAGDRMAMEQRRGAFSGLTLATKREEMLSAVLESIAQASAARIDLLRAVGPKLKSNVVITGGVADGLGDVLHRDWPGRWTFKNEEEATLRGLGTLLS
jgi:xylulokinase